MFAPTLRLILHSRRWLIAALALLLLMAVAVLDSVTGPDFAMAVLYLGPVTLVTLAVGSAAGYVMGMITVAVWAAAELTGAAAYSHQWIALPNAVMRAVYVAMVVYLLSVWRNLGEKLELQVQQRTRELMAEVSERRQAEEAVHRLASQIADAEDAERRRLAQDIHDTVGQTLTLMKFRLQASSAATPSAAASRQAQTSVVPADANDLAELLDDAIRQTRSLTFELYPPMLDDLGLAAGLRWLARELSRQTGSEITVSEEGEARQLPRSIGSYVFRSTRELINTAIKHGRSSEIVVLLYWRGERLRVAVADNGSGFDPAAARDESAAGLGLASIRERVSTLGGTMSVESERGSGTRVIIDVPTMEESS